MADYTVIADVSRTLLQLFRDQMTPSPVLQPELIGLGSPSDKGDLVLSLFLYNIKENGDVRQTGMISRGSSRQQFPPMAVDLYYLVTAHSQAELQTRWLDEQRILGRAIQVLYDNSVLRESALQGTLADHNEEIRVIMEQPITMDTMVSMFSDSGYKLSFTFTVGPVYIDSTRVRSTKRVLERDIQVRGDFEG